MARITDLTYQKKDRERINVFLDGQFAFGLAQSVAAGLRIGQQLSEEDIEDLQKKERLEKARKNALKLVSLRPRSEYEIRTHLRRKSYEDSDIDDVIAYLLKIDLLDDAAFADYWIEQRETFRPRSRFALSQELRQKGISREIIETAVEQVDDRAAARRAVEKRSYQWVSLPEDQYREKMSGFLRRRGFPYEVIREIVEESWRALEDR